MREEEAGDKEVDLAGGARARRSQGESFQAEKGRLSFSEGISGARTGREEAQQRCRGEHSPLARGAQQGAGRALRREGAKFCQ
jgi:hypothetical protein